jgi:hypothetical protein
VSEFLSYVRLFVIFYGLSEFEGPTFCLMYVLLCSDFNSFFFSCNTCIDIRKQIINLSGLVEANRYDSYLGLPTLVGKRGL